MSVEYYLRAQTQSHTSIKVEMENETSDPIK